MLPARSAFLHYNLRFQLARLSPSRGYGVGQASRLSLTSVRSSLLRAICIARIHRQTVEGFLEDEDRRDALSYLPGICQTQSPWVMSTAGSFFSDDFFQPISPPSSVWFQPTE
jgi:hypothetical protein